MACCAALVCRPFGGKRGRPADVIGELAQLAVVENDRSATTSHRGLHCCSMPPSHLTQHRRAQGRTSLDVSAYCPESTHSAEAASSVTLDVVRRRSCSLRLDGVPPLWSQRRAAPGHLARAVAQLRRRPTVGDPARDLPARRSISASPTSIWPTTTGHRMGQPSRTSGASSPPTSPRHRDELLISTKAGYDMWPGPYGDLGSRKYLLASLDQSLTRMGLDYVDIFYSHRVDPDTPLEETVGALVSAVAQGKALYVGHLVVLVGAHPSSSATPGRAQGSAC